MAAPLAYLPAAAFRCENLVPFVGEKVLESRQEERAKTASIAIGRRDHLFFKQLDEAASPRDGGSGLGVLCGLGGAGHRWILV